VCYGKNGLKRPEEGEREREKERERETKTKQFNEASESQMTKNHRWPTVVTTERL